MKSVTIIDLVLPQQEHFSNNHAQIGHWKLLESEFYIGRKAIDTVQWNYLT